MILRYSPTSPYARKVRVLLMETGLEDRVELLATDPWAGEAALARDNPLGKIPVLITDEGPALYDSPVICEYLDALHAGPRRIPEPGPRRWQVLRLQALADGILDAAVLRRLEAVRPQSLRSGDWDALQRRAVARGLDALGAEAADWNEGFDLGRIAAACALGYLDLRFPAENWRAARPTLAAWYARIAQRPAMRATAPPQD